MEILLEHNMVSSQNGRKFSEKNYGGYFKKSFIRYPALHGVPKKVHISLGFRFKSLSKNSMLQRYYTLLKMPSWRHSSATLYSAFNLSRMMRIFSSLEYSLLVLQVAEDGTSSVDTSWSDTSCKNRSLKSYGLRRLQAPIRFFLCKLYHHTDGIKADPRE